MHSNVTRNLYVSRKRAGLLINSTFRIVTADMIFEVYLVRVNDVKGGPFLDSNDGPSQRLKGGGVEGVGS